MLKVKRIYEVAERSDGYRVLVDRLWPRGVSKQKAQVDLWMREIAPSDSLRKWFGHDSQRWLEFQRRYRGELRNKTELIGRIEQLERERHTVTLVFSARDERHNQAVALRAFLKRRGRL